jgi:hypothetical protein
LKSVRTPAVNKWLAIEKYTEIKVATLDWGFPPRSSMAVSKEEEKDDGSTAVGGGRKSFRRA